MVRCKATSSGSRSPLRKRRDEGRIGQWQSRRLPRTPEEHHRLPLRRLEAEHLAAGDIDQCLGHLRCIGDVDHGPTLLGRSGPIEDCASPSGASMR